jgi:hypothetical protein
MPRPKGPAPYAWIYKDPVDHWRHRSFLRSRSQAWFRKEGWELSIEDYFDLWQPELWAQRGRQPEQLCMVRRDVTQPWSKDNCLIVKRYWQMIRGKQSKQKGYGTREIE